jgi:hypothetical protein
LPNTLNEDFKEQSVSSDPGVFLCIWSSNPPDLCRERRHRKRGSDFRPFAIRLWVVGTTCPWLVRAPPCAVFCLTVDTKPRTRMKLERRLKQYRQRENFSRNSSHHGRSMHTGFRRTPGVYTTGEWCTTAREIQPSDTVSCFCKQPSKSKVSRCPEMARGWKVQVTQVGVRLLPCLRQRRRRVLIRPSQLRALDV